MDSKKRKVVSSGRKFDTFYKKKKKSTASHSLPKEMFTDENGSTFSLCHEGQRLLLENNSSWKNGPKTDHVTGFKFIIAKQENVPGMPFSTRGCGVRMKSEVSETNTLVLLSKKGVRVPNQTSIILRKKGFFAMNTLVISKQCATMMINCCNQKSLNERETPNVKLIVLSSSKLKSRFDVNVQSGAYVAVVNTKPLCVDDWLLVKHYGKWSKMPYGKPSYLRLQRRCFQKFEEVKSTKIRNQYMCDKCFKLFTPSPLDKKSNVLNLEHSRECIPFFNTLLTDNDQSDNDCSDIEEDF